MFVDCRNPAGSWERNFGGKGFFVLQCKTIHYIVNVSGNINSWLRVTHEIHEH